MRQMSTSRIVGSDFVPERSICYMYNILDAFPLCVFMVRDVVAGTVLAA